MGKKPLVYPVSPQKQRVQLQAKKDAVAYFTAAPEPFLPPSYPNSRGLVSHIWRRVKNGEE